MYVMCSVVMAGLFGWVGIVAGGADLIFGLLGAVLILAMLGAARAWPAVFQRRSVTVLSFALAVTPLTAHTWWSLVTPILALVTLWVGPAAVARLARITQ